MPFQPLNFLSVETPGNPFARNFADTLFSSLKSGYEMRQMPEKMQRNRESEELALALKQLELQQAPEKFKSERKKEAIENAWKQSQTENLKRKLNEPQSPFGGDYNLQGSAREAYDLDLLGKFVGKDSPVYKNAEKNYLAKSNRRFDNAPIRMQSNVIENIQKDNPGFTEEEAREAADRVLLNENTLSDGKPIRVGGITKQALNSLAKYGTDAASRNRNIFGSQAESEIDVISDAINKAFEPYGDRFSKYSYEQIVDSFDPKDPASQKRLGRYAGGKMLNYELDQLRQMLASGKSTVDAAQEMRKLSDANFKEFWPFKTEIARKEAMDFINQTLKEAFKARKNVDIGAFSASSPYKEKKEEKSETKKRLKFNPSTGGFE